MSVETIARRYGTALADVVEKSGDTDVVKSELKSWESLIADHHDLQSVFGSPAITAVNKESVLESLLERTRPSNTTANLLRVLLRNGRLAELREVNKRFASVLEERSGLVSGQITSARELSKSEKTELQTNLEKLTGKQITLKYHINSEIIGGVVTRIGSTIYDGSVKTQLENLREELING